MPWPTPKHAPSHPPPECSRARRAKVRALLSRQAPHLQGPGALRGADRGGGGGGFGRGSCRHDGLPQLCARKRKQPLFCLCAACLNSQRLASVTSLPASSCLQLLPDLQRRSLVVKDGAPPPGRPAKHALQHYHHTAWPDHGVPPSPEPLLRLCAELRAGGAHAAPILVHCSGAGGRGAAALRWAGCMDAGGMPGAVCSRAQLHACCHASCLIGACAKPALPLSLLSLFPLPQPASAARACFA